MPHTSSARRDRDPPHHDVVDVQAPNAAGGEPGRWPTPEETAQLLLNHPNGRHAVKVADIYGGSVVITMKGVRVPAFIGSITEGTSASARYMGRVR